MNISYNWLKEYVDFDLTPEEVAAALTSIGLETGSVEEVQTIKGGLEGLVIGEVLTCEPHPNSDHMHVTTVNLGQGEPVQIVCGAPNVAAGQKVVVATLGTKLYDGDECFTIKKSKLRGVESNGMICAEDEIGIGTDHAGIIVLPENAVPGTPAKEYYNIKSDYVLEVDITPNRAELAQVVGAWNSEDELTDKAQGLRTKLGLKALLLTRSEEGMTLFTERGRYSVPAQAREVYDVSGAGDTVIAVLASLMAAGVPLEKSVQVANRAGGIVVGKLGTATVSFQELFPKGVIE